ncbi:hypothetical protein G3I44_18560 [Halogeometricum borinquense]|uniref:Uncharacterized protein n=1 Tax=Halogeometricum borinquense TaxID=60847 RepID=A0A6C0UKR6_9EURY|nr:hypothetical protein [Halogeometricum borinquense]QIB76096.1 hypothetical protein G3I44_18560 [Halogeometricum borinquense]
MTATVPQAGAAASKRDLDLGIFLENEKVNSIRNAIPNLELNREDATVYGSSDSIVAVPSNYGKLISAIPNANSSSDLEDSDISASFYFDEWVPTVSDTWEKGTKGRLVATDNGLLFQRGTTPTEKSSLLQAIDRPYFNDNNTKVAVAPEEGRVFFSHKNRGDSSSATDESASVKSAETNTKQSQKRIESVTAIGGDDLDEILGPQTKSESSKEINLKTKKHTTHAISGPQLSSQISAKSTGSGQVGANLLYCIWDYIDCVFCLTASVAPPVSIACWIIVCLDGGLALAMEYITDFGCKTLVDGGVAALEDLVDEYGGQVPRP